MAFPDEQGISVGGVAFTLVNTGRDRQTSEFHKIGNDGTNFHLEIRQTETQKGRNRASVMLREETIVDDLLKEGNNVPQSFQVTTTVDWPSAGVNPVKVSDLLLAAATWLLANNAASRLVNQEN